MPPKIQKVANYFWNVTSLEQWSLPQRLKYFVENLAHVFYRYHLTIEL